MRHVVLLGGVLLAAGCFGPRADPSAFFNLTATGAEAPAPLAARIGLGPMHVPGYLDRPQMVTRLSEHQVRISEADRWAEPLRDNLWRVLAENLKRTVQPEAVIAYPWHPSAGVDMAVSVDFAHFEADTTGTVRLDASWEITDPGTRTLVQRGRSTLDEPVSGSGTEATVQALSRALARLGDDIGRGLRRADVARAGGR